MTMTFGGNPMLKFQLTRRLETARDEDRFQTRIWYDHETRCGCGLGLAIQGEVNAYERFAEMYQLPRVIAKILEFVVCAAPSHECGDVVVRFVRAIPVGVEGDELAFAWMRALLPSTITDKHVETIIKCMSRDESHADATLTTTFGLWYPDVMGVVEMPFVAKVRPMLENAIHLREGLDEAINLAREGEITGKTGSTKHELEPRHHDFGPHIVRVRDRVRNDGRGNGWKLGNKLISQLENLPKQQYEKYGINLEGN